MWEELLRLLAHTYPKAVRLYPVAADTDISLTETALDIEIPRLDPNWLKFLQYTNGASLLDYCFLGARNSKIADIGQVNQELWQFNPWARQHFLAFLGDSTGCAIGLVREGQTPRCIGYLKEPSDNTVLPIASSFATFLESFLEDVETTLKTWKAQPNAKMPYEITTQPLWPWDLRSFVRRDPELSKMLENGSLNDLFKDDLDYATVVDSLLE